MNNDIRELPVFKEFYNWELNTGILHFKSENFIRNLEIYKIYLGRQQNLHLWSLTKMGNKYGVSKERIRQIFNRYQIHFILYLYYKCRIKRNNELLNRCLGLLSGKDMERVVQHFIDGKPFKYITRRELTIFKV